MVNASTGNSHDDNGGPDRDGTVSATIALASTALWGDWEETGWPERVKVLSPQ